MSSTSPPDGNCEAIASTSPHRDQGLLGIAPVALPQAEVQPSGSSATMKSAPMLS